MAKACPKDYSEYIARTKKIVDKWLKELNPEDQVSAIKILHLKMQAENPEKAEAFREVVAQTYPEYVVYNAFEETLDISTAPVSHPLRLKMQDLLWQPLPYHPQ